MTTKTLTVKVTQDDITNGIRVDPFACPIALALKRLELIEPEVNTIDVSWYGHPYDPYSWRKTAYLPVQAVTFVEYFDDESFPNSALTPFTFTLEFEEAE